MRLALKARTEILAGFTASLLCVGSAAGVEAGAKAGDVKDTALGRLAAAMKPGEMKKLETGNCNRQLLKSWYDWEKNLRGAHKGYSVISWSNDANWDSKSRQIFHFGLGHYASPKFISYSADALSRVHWIGTRHGSLAADQRGNSEDGT